VAYLRKDEISDLSTNQKDRAKELHNKAIVIDDLEMPWVLQDKWFPDVLNGGIDVLALDLLVGAIYDLNEKVFSFVNACKWIDWLYAKIEENSHLTLARTASDIRGAKKEKKVAILIATQDMDMIMKEANMPYSQPFDWSLLRTLYRLGLRQGMPCSARGNILASGCIGPRDAGLSYIGVGWVEEMNRLGMIIDGNLEVSVKSALDCAEHSKDPIILSHTNARKMCDNRRNAPDELIKAVAEKGGVIGVTPVPGYVSSNPNPSLGDLLDHVDYISDLVGVNHIGFGWDHTQGFSSSDQERLTGLSRAAPEIFSRNRGVPYVVESLKDTPKFTMGMVARGYSDEEIIGILGGNVLRVYQEVLGH
jgi:membrane dipeptidase